MNHATFVGWDNFVEAFHDPRFINSLKVTAIFTEDEVKKLCTGHHMDYEEMRRWYDGYYFDEIGHVYNPNSVIKAVFCGKYSNYWTQTETYESLRIYIDLNFDGLKECLVDMLGGKRCRVDIGSFQNDMTSMKSRDDVLTLLVHLGYLGYDADNKEVYIPNEEIREEFIRAIKNGRRQELVKAIQLSDHLLKATIQKDGDTVAKLLAEAHMANTSPKFYNDEQALRSVYYTELFDAKLNGRYMEQNWNGGYAQGAVTISTLGKSASSRTGDRVKKTEEKIKNGKKQIAYFSTRALDGILESEKGQEQ